ncbi:MAG: ParB/RepB/Spo0J family partition protein [Gammaproteobacteria bacterium]|nr:ParB/RepB/Spo0J family partition protein [Gammaproteobacteria bacterium]
MVKKRGLGKSLDALLSYTSKESTSPDDTSLHLVQDTLTQLSVDLMVRGKYQPRREMDEEALEELAHSIRTQGIIQPLIVRPVDKHRYEIIAGERRYRAAKMAGLTTVPVIVRTIPDEAALAIALIENIQRENLNPIEEAIALMRLIDEFGMTHQQVAEAVGKSRTSVTNLLRLLVLPEEVKTMLERGQLEMGHARTLITLPEATQLEAALAIASRELSVRETEQYVRRLQQPQEQSKDKSLNPDLKLVQDNLTNHLKLRVAIQCNAKGKGKLVIHYRSLNELNRLLAEFERE